MRAVLFDLDETILDRSRSLKDFARWQATGMLRSCLDDVDRFVTRFVELDQQGTVWKDKVYAVLIQEFGLAGWSVDELLSVYWLTFCAFCHPRNGANETIHAFRDQGFKIGLISNGKSPFQERNFQHLSVSVLFDVVVVSEAVGLRKPDKAIFNFACKKLGVEPQNCIFVGDNPIADIKGAKDAGMQTVYVPVKSDRPPCGFADRTFLDLCELARYVEMGWQS